MATEKKKRVINRLQAMYPLRAQVDKAYERSNEAIKEGNPVAWAMLNWWEGDIILQAMGVEVVYPENYGAVCAALGKAEPYLKRSDEEGFPSHLCGYARNCLGYTARMMNECGGEIPPEAPMGGMPKPVLLMGRALGCDAGSKWFQALGRYMDVPVWILEIPHPGVRENAMEGAYEATIQFMVKEMRAFVAFLERLLGKKLDWAKLEETTYYTLEIGRLWYEINELRKNIPCPMHSRDFWSCMTPVTFPSGDLKETARLYQGLYDEVKYRVDNNIGAIANEVYRLAFAELPPWHSLWIFDRLAERGWDFVVETRGYHLVEPLDLNKVSDPIERIARICYNTFAGYFKGALEEGEYLGHSGYPYLEFARTYKCDGAFLHPLLSCRTASTHLWYVQDKLLRKLNVPSLFIEGDIVDLSLFDPDDAMQKAEAFEEVMDYYKGVRKKEGKAES